MDYDLNVPAIVRRAEQLFGHKEIVTRNPDKSFHRYTYADFVPRSRRLAQALRNLGLEDGDRVGTFAWNHYRHLEAYLGPAGGRARDPHAQPAAPPRRPHLHRPARRRPRADRGQGALAARREVRRARRLRARDRDLRRRRRPGRDARLRDAAGLGRWRRPGARDRREGCRGHVLHERHHRPAEGRRLLPPRDRDPHALRDDGRLARRHRGGRRPPRRPDVPRERLGLPLPVHADRLDAGLPRPAPRSGEPARDVRAGARDADRGRAHDLDGDPGDARRRPEALRPLGAEGDGRRRLGGAPLDDRGLPGAARPQGDPRLGDDGDGAARDDLRALERAAEAAAGRAVRLPRQAGLPGRVRGDPRPRRSGARPLGRRLVRRARGARPLDRVVLLRRRLAGRPLDRRRVVPDRATSSRSSRTATSRSRIAPRTSSSPGASGSRPSRSRTR